MTNPHPKPPMRSDVLEISPAAMGRLDRLGPPGALVLSVCFGLDPAVPNASTRAVYARGRLDEAARELERDLPEEEETGLRAALRELRDVVVPAVESHRSLHGIAAFADGEGDALVFGLRRPPVQPIKAAFREEPLCEPLLEARPGPSWGVLVVNRSIGTVFRGSELGLVEVASIEDAVRARHSQDGWSHGGHQRGIEKEVHDHVAGACSLLEATDRRLRFERLAVVASAEVWTYVESCLDRDLRDRLAGHVLEDLPDPRPEKVFDLVRPFISHVDRVREAEALEQLEERLAKDGRAAAGSAAVLEAIAQRKVELLLVDAGWEDESVDTAIAGATEQDADVIFVKNRALDPLGHVAALLRY